MSKEFKYKYMLIPCEDPKVSKELIIKAINDELEKLTIKMHEESSGKSSAHIDNIRKTSEEICELMNQRNHIILLGSNEVYGAPCFEYDDRLELIYD